jgi:hypothetical protein
LPALARELLDDRVVLPFSGRSETISFEAFALPENWTGPQSALMAWMSLVLLLPPPQATRTRPAAMAAQATRTRARRRDKARTLLDQTAALAA